MNEKDLPKMKERPYLQYDEIKKLPDVSYVFDTKKEAEDFSCEHIKPKQQTVPKSADLPSLEDSLKSKAIRVIGECSGQCCQSMQLSKSPDDLNKYYKRWLRGDDGGLRDIHDIFKMLLYKGRSKWYGPHADSSDVDAYEYECQHFNHGTKRCNYYRYRPDVCRSHPLGGTNNYECHYPGCTFKVEINLKYY